MSDRAGARAGRTGGGGMTAALLLVGAAMIAGSAFAPWGRRDYRDALTGPLTVTVTGSDVLPALVPVALVILAAWAAAAMSRGVLRRVLACSAAIAALGIGVAAILGAWRVPADEYTRQLRRPAEELGATHVVVWSVLISVLGGLVATAGGVLLATARTAARSTRGSYDAHAAPAARREAAAREAEELLATKRHGEFRGPEADQAAPAPAELAAEQLWRSLDVGVDPTVGAADEAVDHPGEGPHAGR